MGRSAAGQGAADAFALAILDKFLLATGLGMGHRPFVSFHFGPEWKAPVLSQAIPLPSRAGSHQASVKTRNDLGITLRVESGGSPDCLIEEG